MANSSSHLCKLPQLLNNDNRLQQQMMRPPTPNPLVVPEKTSTTNDLLWLLSPLFLLSVPHNQSHVMRVNGSTFPSLVKPIVNGEH